MSVLVVAVMQAFAGRESAPSRVPDWQNQSIGISSVTPPCGDRTIESLSTAVQQVLDPHNGNEMRRQELYAMTMAGPKAAESLARIASQPLPAENAANIDFNSPNHTRPRFERNLRVAALEALDRLAYKGEAVRAQVQRILRLQHDPALSFLARTSLAGIDDGHPGKLGRLLDRMAEPRDTGRSTGIKSFVH
ncbi:MAG TPA: hypothetical protein VHI52_08730, partial [Verrucomicrobiae bacterium]|nr:hypothetical protein [Verrucomicrobiae bacterium]